MFFAARISLLHSYFSVFANQLWKMTIRPLISVRPSTNSTVRIKQRHLHWMGFRGMLYYMGLLFKFVYTFWFWLQRKKVRHFTWRPTYIYNISLLLVFKTETNHVHSEVRHEAEATIDDRSIVISPMIDFESVAYVYGGLICDHVKMWEGTLK
jgi:hypothetical protein